MPVQFQSLFNLGKLFLEPNVQHWLFQCSICSTVCRITLRVWKDFLVGWGLGLFSLSLWLYLSECEPMWSFYNFAVHRTILCTVQICVWHIWFFFKYCNSFQKWKGIARNTLKYSFPKGFLITVDVIISLFCLCITCIFCHKADCFYYVPDSWNLGVVFFCLFAMY